MADLLTLENATNLLMPPALGENHPQLIRGEVVYMTPPNPPHDDNRALRKLPVCTRQGA